MLGMRNRMSRLDVFFRLITFLTCQVYSFNMMAAVLDDSIKQSASSKFRVYQKMTFILFGTLDKIIKSVNIVHNLTCLPALLNLLHSLLQRFRELRYGHYELVISY